MLVRYSVWIKSQQMSFIKKKKERTGETRQSLGFIMLQVMMRYGEVESISGHFIPLWEEQRIAYPLNRGMGWLQSWSWTSVEEENLLSLPGNEPQFIGRPVRYLVTAATLVSTPLIGPTETNDFASQTETLTMRASIRLFEEYRR
jgi:hypothetical protein